METLGERLKKAREAKGLSIEELVKMTKISERNLKALEQGLYDELPFALYVKGFLKLYSRCVGLGSASVIEEYEKSQTEPAKQVLILQGEKVSTPGLWELVGSFLKGVDRRFWAGLGILTALFLMLAFWSRPDSEKEASREEPTEAIHSPSSSPLRSESSSSNLVSVSKSVSQHGATVSVPLAPSVHSEPLVLASRVKGPVWLRVRSDDHLVFEGTLKKGDQETWQAKDYFLLRVGNPDVIEFRLNGKDLGRMGRSGKVKDIRITKEGWYVSE